MKLMLDNNVLIDAITNRAPFSENARKILMLCAKETASGFISANSATDIFYVLQRLLGYEAANKAVWGLLQSLYTITVTHADCIKALQMPIRDFEDALLVLCAIKIQPDYIVTRDEEFLKADLPIPIVSPEKLLEILVDAKLCDLF